MCAFECRNCTEVVQKLHGPIKYYLIIYNYIYIHNKEIMAKRVCHHLFLLEGREIFWGFVVGLGVFVARA